MSGLGQADPGRDLSPFIRDIAVLSGSCNDVVYTNQHGTRSSFTPTKIAVGLRIAGIR